MAGSSPQVVAHLLPHLSAPETVTALFPQATMAHGQLMKLSAPLDAVPDETSRSRWEVAATEAANSRSPERLDRLARYPQKKVRRQVAENPSCMMDTLRYLLSWAADKDDTDTLAAIATSHASEVVFALLDECEDAVKPLWWRRVALDAAEKLPARGPVHLAGRLLSGLREDMTSVPHQIAGQFVRAYGRTGPEQRAFTLAEAFRVGGIDRIDANALQTVVTLQKIDAHDAGLIARLLQQSDLPDGLSDDWGSAVRRVYQVTPEAGRVLATSLVGVHRRWIAELALSGSAMAEEGYDALIDHAVTAPADSGCVNATIRSLCQPQHAAALDPRLASRIVDEVVPLGRLSAQNALLTFTAIGHLLDHDRASALVGACGTEIPYAWLTTWSTSDAKRRRLDPRRSDPLRVPDPELARQVMRQVADDVGRAQLCYDAIAATEQLRLRDRHRGVAPEDRGLSDAVIDALLEEAGVAALRSLGRPQMSRHVARYLEQRIGTGPEPWQVAVGLLQSHWEQGLVELVTTVRALAGIDDDQPTDDQPTDEPTLTLF